MPIFYPDVLDERTEPFTFNYGDKDVILYALSVGMGRDPLDGDELAFVSEKGLKVMPTAATVLSAAQGRRPRPGPPADKPDHRASSVNSALRVHGDQKVVWHRPLPAAGTFTVETRNVAAFDKGQGKGALVVAESIWTDAAGEAVATLTSTSFCRGDGGFGGPAGGGDEPHPKPNRPADLSVDLQTTPEQALLYRLNGDRNPLHSDPAWAKRSGFPRPILHGLCTFGVSCHAILKAATGYDPERILSHQARFSAPVFPGDLLTVDIWCDGKAIAFEARVKARGVTVLKNGLTRLR